jgi:Tol biopolymer transport system component
MGEVYRALDTRLDRTVAVKILPEGLAGDAQFRERFDREARAISQLTHPHICVLYDVGHQDGSDYLVMEYLEGETLEQRLNKGAVPVNQALQYAIETAEALDKAHRSGIVHRDLKPGNIMLTKGGAKLLDFGLAKSGTSVEPVAGLSMLPTTPPGLTAQGTILGTFQYMAPEQLEGKEADARTDIFAFGAVLYETLTGKKAFEAKSQASLIASILEHQPPPPSTVQPLAPSAVDRVVATCLAKDPDDRWQSARDLVRELRWIADGSSHTGLRVPLKAQSKTQERVVWASAGFVLAATAGAVLAWTMGRPAVSPPSAPQPIKRVTIGLAATEPLAPAKFAPLAIGRKSIALSPDGSLLAYAAERGGTSQLYVRALDRFDARPIPGTEGAYDPFFSPDGRSLGFFSENKLKKVSLQGGEPVTLCEARIPHGATWGPDDTIVFADSEGVNPSRVSASGGKPEALLKSEDFTRTFYPEFLPGGKAVLFSTRDATSPDKGDIGVLSLATGERRVLIKGGTNPRYAASGHIVFAGAGEILAAPFDLARLETTGPTVSLVEGIRIEEWGAAQFALSREGTLVYVSGGPAWIGTLTWVDQQGRSTPLVAPAQAYGGIHLSPDGKRLAVSVWGATTDVWVYEFARGAFSRLTVEGSISTARWTPDGKRIVYSRSTGPNQFELVSKPADGGGADQVLARSKLRWVNESFSPDGKLGVFHEWPTDTGMDLWTLPVSGDRPPSAWLKTKFNEWGGRFSPDGKFMAYSSDESGEFEIYVQPYPGPGTKVQVSIAGGEEVVWSRDGRRLFYRNRTTWMAVDIEAQPEFRAEAPQAMFEGPYLNIPGVSYDVASDGRFIMIEEHQKQTPTTELNVVFNWFEELKARVPTN